MVSRMHLVGCRIVLCDVLPLFVTAQQREFSLPNRPSDMKVDGDGRVFLAAGSQLLRLDSTLALQENVTLGSSVVRVALSSDERRVVVCLGDLSCVVYNASDFAAGEQLRRFGASDSSQVLALFTAEENSFYVGSILTGASPSMNLRQYGFADRNFNRTSDYRIFRSGFERAFFSGFVSGGNAYYFMADGEPNAVRGLRVLRTCDSSSFEALYELRLDCGSGTFPQGALICGLSVLDSFAGSADTTVVLSRCNAGSGGRNRACSFRLAGIDDRMNTYYRQLRVWSHCTQVAICAAEVPNYNTKRLSSTDHYYKFSLSLQHPVPHHFLFINACSGKCILYKKYVISCETTAVAEWT